jgi:integrase/recombinase XerD
VRTYDFLKLYWNSKARTPLERQQNKENKDLAQKIRADRESEINHSIHKQISPAKKKVNYFDYAEKFRTEYRKKDLKMIKAVVKRFEDFLTDKMPGVKLKTLKISQIDKSMMLRFVDYLNGKGTGEGAHSYFQRFKKILNHAVEEGVINKSPADGVKVVRVEAMRKEILSNAEIALLAKAPCQNTNIVRAFIFCCCTGLRFCDVKVLTYANIDFSAGKLKTDQQKTGIFAIIDLNNTATKLIGKPGEPGSLIFELPDIAGCNKTLKGWVARAGIKKHITWHCARHSFAVNLLTSPQHPDIKTVSSTLGHTSLKHTEKYTRVVDELKKKAVNALPDYDV